MKRMSRHTRGSLSSVLYAFQGIWAAFESLQIRKFMPEVGAHERNLIYSANPHLYLPPIEPTHYLCPIYFFMPYSHST